MATLTRFWFKFEKLSSPSVVNLGCGVTAFSVADAEDLLRNSVFHGQRMPMIAAIEDIDVSELDSRHVLPNIGQVAQRGVWFPQIS